MKKITLFLFFTILLVPSLFSQGLNSVASFNSNNVLAVGNSGKILRTITGGSGWSLNTNNPTVNYKSVTQAGNYYFISGDNGKVYKTPVTNLLLNEYTTGVTTSLNSINFLDSLNGFACGANGVIIKTSNGGLNWTAINNGVLNIRLNAVSFRNNLNGIAVGDSGVVYLTTNGGTNWTLQTFLTTRNLLKVKYYNEGIAITGEYGIIIRRDIAGSFQIKTSKTKSDIRGISGTYASNHICGGGGFIRNNKNGSDNYFNFEINPMMANLVDIVFADSTTGYAISSLNDAIIKTNDGGSIWDLTAGTTVNVSWVSKLVTSGGIGNNLCQHPTDRNSLFVMYGNRVYVSRDKAETWTQISTTSLGTSTHTFYVSPIDTNIWVAAIESSTDKVIRTTDYGVTWSTILTLNFSNYGQPLEMDQNNPSTFYFAPDGGGFYKSTDVGASFTEISGAYPFRSPCDIIVMYDSSNVVFLADGVTGSGLGEIFKSVNGGVNWTKVFTNSSSSEIPALANSVFDRSTMYATNWPSGSVYWSKDYGDNWTLLRTNSSSGWGSDVCREDPTLVLTGSYGPSTFLSTNSGTTFNTYSSGGGAGAGMIVPDRSYLINMMTGGLYKTSISYSVITEVSENIVSGIPKNFNLYQNYPNPFNPTTKIKFDLPISGNIKLAVFDNLGREIQTVVNSYRNSGTYEISFDGSRLSTGVYFYRISTNDVTETRRMLLIK
jgi:photosystem II stability/assembly factor-like uncharacterized protein